MSNIPREIFPIKRPIPFIVGILSSAIIFLGCVGPVSAQKSDSINQTYGQLRISVFSIQAYGQGKVRVVLRLRNLSDKVNVLVAEKSRVYWNPQSNASLNDDAGREYKIDQIRGIGFGRSVEDLVMLSPGGSLPVTYEFIGTATSGGRFAFSTEYLVGWGKPGETVTLTGFQVYLSSIPIQ